MSVFSTARCQGSCPGFSSRQYSSKFYCPEPAGVYIIYFTLFRHSCVLTRIGSDPVPDPYGGCGGKIDDIKKAKRNKSLY